MTDLYLQQWDMPSAGLGAPNLLPPIQGDASLAKTADLGAATEEMQARAAYGRVRSVCPYLLQDSYTRERQARSHPVAVLANENLRATFLLGLGGRLWSLVHRPTGRELLFANPVFQPANLALRNAWFAGGVEWNIGTIGHTPLTCEPMHAVRVSGADGTPVLRMYEFERIRRVVYQLDVHLPPGSQTLFVHVRISNPNAHEVPMYWWSNIAVPQGADTRVLAPAERAWNYSYDNVLRHEAVAPGGDGEPAGTPDISYPARFASAADFFFDLGGIPQPWIAAVDDSGCGLFQTSTAELVGRKLFRWGVSGGGRRWQHWLTGSPDGYAEIQAGLASTQFEHVPMPAGACWSWTEGYGPMALPPDAAHGGWARARAAAGAAVQAAVPAVALAEIHARAEDLADREPESVLHTGSGWGALERHIRVRAGEPAIGRAGTPFGDEALAAAQQPWLDLLETGEFPDPPPGGFPVSVHLHPLLAEMLQASPGWAAPALAGVARAAEGDWDGARDAWQESLRRVENAYARRNLAIAATHDGDRGAAAGQYLRALESTAQWYRPLVVEALAALLAAEMPTAALAVIDGSPAGGRSLGRVRMYEAAAALAAGDLTRCGAILQDPGLEVADLREGELSLDRMWWDYRTQLAAAQRGTRPDAALRSEIERTVALPPHLDFRMHTAGPASRPADRPPG